MILLGFPDPFHNKPTSLPCPGGEGEACCPCSGRSLATAQRGEPLPPGGWAAGRVPSELEQVDEVLWRHGHEATVGVGGGAGVPRVLREQRRGVTTERPAPSQRRVEHADPRSKDGQPRGTVSRDRWPKAEGPGPGVPCLPGLAPHLHSCAVPLLPSWRPLGAHTRWRPGSCSTGRVAKGTGAPPLRPTSLKGGGA